MNTTLDPAVENIIMYIPVADETGGGTPKLNKRGLKIAPPPKPRAPETQPPIKANISSLDNDYLVNLRSLFSNLPALSFIY